MQACYVFGDTPFRLELREDRAAYDPVLLRTELGDPVDRFSFAFHRLLEASEDELARLREAGYEPAA